MEGKYVKCPHCGRRVGFRDRILKCAYSGELICNHCAVSGRFSDSVADKIPPEYREKFRSWNALSFFVVAFAGFLVLQRAWYTFGGWHLGDLDALLDDALFILGMLFAGALLLFFSTRLPHVGTWLYYFWISKPENRAKVEKAVETYSRGEYVPESRLYRLKVRFFEHLKATRTRSLLFSSVALNLATLAFWFVLPNVPSLAGTYLSAFAGAVFVASLVLNYLVLAAAAGYYCQKTPENANQRRVVEFLSWAYALLQPVVYVSFLLGALDLLGMSDAVGLPHLGWLFWVYWAAFVVQAALAVLLSFSLATRFTPNYQLGGGGVEGAPTYRKARPSLGNLLRRLPKTLVTALVLGLLLFVLLLTIEITVVDATMAISVLSSTYLLVGVYLPVIFFALKLVDRRPKKYDQTFWAVAKVGTIIVAVNLAPAIMTVAWTNPSLEAQFDAAFGPGWRDSIPAAQRAKFRQVRFSAFDAFFGFTFPSNAKFGTVYATDSPRYVRQGGVVLANGSEKYEAKVNAFRFDAYLPPDVKFGEGDDRLPVVVFMHGIGMDHGAENANLTSQYIANLGYLVCDMEYGFTGWTGPTGGRDGYDFPDTIRQIGAFTRFLEANAAEFHADLNNVYFAGRSFGGWMATVCAWGYNTSFFGANFSSAMTVRGVIPYYGAVGIPSAGSELMGLPFLGFDAPYIRGSSDPAAEDYNPEWVFYDPFKLVDPATSGNQHVAPALFIHGTNDPLVPPGWSQQLARAMRSHGHVAVEAYYPLGSHGCDALHWSQFGQSTLYYLERFLALTTARV
ncbi:MAG: hypothetical protein Kow0069_03560 [Promethearchaeota archaeon]